MHATLLLSLLLTLALATTVHAMRGGTNPFDSAKTQAAISLGIPQSSGLAEQVAFLILKDQQVHGGFAPALARAGRNQDLAQSLVGGNLSPALQRAIKICRDNQYDWSCRNAIGTLTSQMNQYYPAARYPSVSDSYPYGFSLYDDDLGF